VPSPSLIFALDDFDVASFSRVAAAFAQDRYAYVVTPNVDHVLRYYDQPSLRGLYHAAGFVLLDSRVVARAVRLLTGLRLKVCPGSDLTQALLSDSVSSGDRILIVGGSTAQSKRLAARYGLADVRHHAPPMRLAEDPAAIEQCLQFIEAQSPFRFCFLAVGSPQQEVIANALQSRGKARGLALCVGASLNFLSGAEKRAPRWMQRASLEWLYRLLHDPRRLAGRYLVRGPRIFGLLWRRQIVLRRRSLDPRS
jgi:exopolysaccharide biosynthesis WecB/TagA/CpsF family protein